MHLMHAAAPKSEAKDAQTSKAADKLHEFCMAVEAVADAELLELGLPVLRSVLTQKHCPCAKLQNAGTLVSALFIYFCM